MTTEEQMAAINTKQFLVSLTAQVKGLHTALQTNGVKITGEGWINFLVNQVSVRYIYSDADDLTFQVGDDGSGNGLKSFSIPTNWLVG